MAGFLADKVIDFFLADRPPGRVAPIYLGKRIPRIATPEAAGTGDEP
ncbi:MAG: hypothetical protein GTO31_04310 [Xanthomonadales bacterium]|nr:hypothetical protein [Xanthomonadales bacterium]